MKKAISILLVFIILATTVTQANAVTNDTSIHPRWTYLDTVSAYLDINLLGIASCEGTATAGKYVTVKVTVRLQQLTDTGWATLKSWTVTDMGSASASGNYAVYSGYTYRTTVTGYVYDSDGNLVETGTATDTFEY